MSKIIHKDLSYLVRGVLIEVHKKLGCSLSEQFYQEAITYEFETLDVSCVAEKSFQVMYRGVSAGTYYVDHWIENGFIILEVKVARQILPIHKAQALSYLKLTNADLAIVANFGSKLLEDQRLPNFFREQEVDLQVVQFPACSISPWLVDKLNDALHRVHITLGSGFIHRVYRRALMIELEFQGVGYEDISQIQIYYKDQFLGVEDVKVIRVENEVLLAAFAVKEIHNGMVLKMNSYLKNLNVKVGLLVNFYGERLGIKVVSR
jgi:GxxExxY protein